MAVPKTTATRCRDRAYKHCTNNPITTSFFVRDIFPYAVRLLGDNIVHEKRCRDGVICAVFVCPVSTPSCSGFWHCHPYMPVHFWKMFYLLVCVTFCCTIVHHIGGCYSSALPSGTKKQTHDHRQLMLCVMGWEYIKLRTTTWGRG